MNIACLLKQDKIVLASHRLRQVLKISKHKPPNFKKLNFLTSTAGCAKEACFGTVANVPVMESVPH